jgi:hypothetical protein
MLVKGYGAPNIILAGTGVLILLDMVLGRRQGMPCPWRPQKIRKQIVFSVNDWNEVEVTMATTETTSWE